MVKKFALFAFNGDPMCFIHVIIKALEMLGKGYDIKVIVEGSATKLIYEFENEDNPFYKQFNDLKNSGLIDCFCKACSKKMGALKEVERLRFPTCAELIGHPSMAKYIEEGYRIITF